MPIECKTYIVHAKVKFAEGEELNYYWDAELNFKLNNIVLSDKECQDLMSKVAGVFISHGDKLENIEFGIKDTTFKTKRENDLEEIDKLENIIANWEIGDVEGQEELDKKQERLAKLYEKYPELAPKKPEDIDPDYEAAVADLQPTFAEDLKCEDEEA